MWLLLCWMSCYNFKHLLSTSGEKEESCSCWDVWHCKDTKQTDDTYWWLGLIFSSIAFCKFLSKHSPDYSYSYVCSITCSIISTWDCNFSYLSRVSMFKRWLKKKASYIWHLHFCTGITNCSIGRYQLPIFWTSVKHVCWQLYDGDPTISSKSSSLRVIEFHNY